MTVDPFYHLYGTGNGHNTQINRIEDYQRRRERSSYRLLPPSLGGYKQDAYSPIGQPGYHYDAASGQYYYNQNIRPPVDPLQYDTATTLGNTRSRVQDQTLGKIAGYGGLVLDFFSGGVSAVGKLINLLGGGYERSVDSRVQSVSHGGNVFHSSSSTNNNPSSQMSGMIDQVWQQTIKAINDLSLKISKTQELNKKISEENKALLEQLKNLKSKKPADKVDAKPDIAKSKKKVSKNVSPFATWTNEEKKSEAKKRLEAFNDKAASDLEFEDDDYILFVQNDLAILEESYEPEKEETEKFNKFTKNFPYLALNDHEPITKEKLDKLKVRFMQEYGADWDKILGLDEYLRLSEILKKENDSSETAEAIYRNIKDTNSGRIDDDDVPEFDKKLEMVASLRPRKAVPTKYHSQFDFLKDLDPSLKDLDKEKSLTENQIKTIKQSLVKKYKKNWPLYFGNTEFIKIMK